MKQTIISILLLALTACSAGGGGGSKKPHHGYGPYGDTYGDSAVGAPSSRECSYGYTKLYDMAENSIRRFNESVRKYQPGSRYYGGYEMSPTMQERAEQAVEACRIYFQSTHGSSCLEVDGDRATSLSGSQVREACNSIANQLKGHSSTIARDDRTDRKATKRVREEETQARRNGDKYGPGYY
jgi:hypothetical protein